MASPAWSLLCPARRFSKRNRGRRELGAERVEPLHLVAHADDTAEMTRGRRSRLLARRPLLDRQRRRAELQALASFEVRLDDWHVVDRGPVGGAEVGDLSRLPASSRPTCRRETVRSDRRSVQAGLDPMSVRDGRVPSIARVAPTSGPRMTRSTNSALGSGEGTKRWCATVDRSLSGLVLLGGGIPGRYYQVARTRTPAAPTKLGATPSAVVERGAAT